MNIQEENLIKNTRILRMNLERGLSYDKAMNVISNMENDFKAYNLFNDMAENYINDMKAIVVSYFTKIDISIEGVR